MTKRLFAWVLVLAMLLSLLPAITVGVSAAGEDNHTDHTGWTKWTNKTALPTAAGKYYLDVDVTLSTAWTAPSGHVQLCLNGHTVSKTGTTRVITLNAGRELSIYDCAEAYNALGEYVGGKIVGGDNANNGMIIVARGTSTAKNAVLNLYGGRLCGNRPTKTGLSGGAVYLQTGQVNKAGGVFNMYGGEVYDNEAQYGGVVSIPGETAANRGTAPAAFHMYGGKLHGNKSTTGTLYATNDGIVDIQGGQIVKNEATNGSAIYATGDTVITLKDVEITDNTATSSSTDGNGSTICLRGLKIRLTLSGKVTMERNKYHANGCDITLNNDAGGNMEKVYVDGLTQGTVRFTVKDTAVAEASDVVAFAGTNTAYADGALVFVEDGKEKPVVLVNGEFLFEGSPAAITHKHKLGNDGEEIGFKAWTRTDSLPTEGNYYLTANVELTAAVTATNLNLCLNGFTVTQKTAGQRILNVGNASTAVEVSLTDCQGGGKLTGGTATYGTCVSIRHKSTFNLYGGTLTGNAKGGSGAEGTVYMQGNSPCGNTFNMYGGEITGNTARVGGAVSIGAPAATVTNIPRVNIYGGKLTGNTAEQTGGAIHASGNAKIHLENVQITGNQANQGGAVYMTTEKVTLTIAGATVVFDNTAAGKPNNVYLSGSQIITLGTVAENAKVGVTVAQLGRAISSQSGSDYTANFLSDSSSKNITYKQNALWIEEYSDHQHCVCDGMNIGTCDHSKQMWLAWGDDDEEKTSLPTASGYYYLTQDIQMSAFTFPSQEQEIYLCLNGKTVTAAENDRHLNVSNKTVFTVTDCSAEVGGFTGGNRTFGGSVNINAGGILNLYAGKFYGNNAPDSEGGAIYLQRGTTIDGGILNMYGGQIFDNTALYGGGIRAAGLLAGATAKATVVNIYGGLITDNHSGTMTTVDANGKETVTNGHGGGIDTAVGTQLNLYGGTISKNTSAYNGGGIYLAESTFLMEGGTITDNSAVNFGGGFFDAMGTVTLKGGKIKDNQSSARGGAFVANGTVMDIYGVTISGNRSVEGAVTYMNQASKKVDGKAIIYPAKITVHDGAKFTGNVASKNAGTFLVANPDVQLIIEGGEFTKNKAANGGAIMIWKGAAVTMKGGKISNNSVDLGVGGGVYTSNDATFVMEGGTISGNTARIGSGVYGDRAVLELKGGSISNNRAKIKYTYKDGKQVKSGGQGAVYIQGCTLNIRGTAINNNHSESSGGGVVMTRQTTKTNGVETVFLAKVNMYGGSISYNYSGAAAGGLLVQSTGTVTNIYGGTIAGNESKSGGGGIYVSTKSTLNMYGGTITGNKSNTAGGGLYVAQGIANISNVTFTKNTATANAAQLLVTGNECVVVAKNCKFLEGESKSGGVTVVQSRAHATFENCDFGNNKASAGAGGAVYISTRSVGDLIGCKFWGNTADNNAGALMVSNFATVNVTDSDFTENHSEALGGVAYVSPAATVTFTGTTFTKCTSATRGGAIVCRGNIFLIDSVIENCTAAAEGGAIATDVNTMGGGGIMRGLVVENSVIRNNTAGGKGGGIYGWKGCRVELYNCEITGNISPEDGSALWAYEDLELHNTKITGNVSGNGGYAVYMNDANFDGQSYMASKNKLSGNTIIRDNEGKQLYMGPDVVFAITGEGLGQDAYIELELDSGVITNRIQGLFHYEGGNCLYTVTYGDRSWTEPEIDPALVVKTEEKTESKGGDVLLYVGIGVVGLAAVAAVVLVALKKKKSAAAEKN